MSLVTDKPSAPQAVRLLEQYKDFISIQWDEPASDGGSRLTGYIIEKRDANRTLWTQIGEVGGDVRRFKATKLYEGSSYMFRVAAENAIGQGPFGQIEDPVTAKLPFGEYIEFSLSIWNTSRSENYLTLEMITQSQ